MVCKTANTTSDEESRALGDGNNDPEFVGLVVGAVLFTSTGSNILSNDWLDIALSF
jgi:hypothetical protein